MVGTAMEPRAEEVVCGLAASLQIPLAWEASIIASADANCAVLMTPIDVLRVEWRAPLRPRQEEDMWVAAQQAGLPAPTLLADGTFHGRPWMRYCRLPGSSSTHTPGALAHAGKLLAGLHAAPASAFPHDLHARPRRMTRYADALSVCDSKGTLSVWRPLVELAAIDWEERYEVASHGDFRSANLLSTGEQVTGVIDWSDGRRSTRERDLGSIDGPSFGAILAGYLPALSSPAPVSGRLVLGHAMARYAALLACGIVTTGHAKESVELIHHHLLHNLGGLR